MAPGTAAKRRGGDGGGGSHFPFLCGCNDAKSVSVSDGSGGSYTAAPPRRRLDAPSSCAEAHPFTSASSSSSSASASPYFWSAEADEEKPLPDSPSFSGLLRQLGELEQSVKAFGPSSSAAAAAENSWPPPPPPTHRRSRSEGSFGSGRVEESVAVVTESEDPLRDFRRSMLQMIIEKEIVSGEELRELLRRFLAINSPHHHDLILRAFADILTDVFAGYERTPEPLLVLLRRSSASAPRLPPPRRRC